MEDSRVAEEGYFWFNRCQNGWPPVPQGLLDDAKRIIEAEKASGNVRTFCGIPLAELTREECLTALVLYLHWARYRTED